MYVCILCFFPEITLWTEEPNVFSLVYTPSLGKRPQNMTMCVCVFACVCLCIYMLCYAYSSHRTRKHIAECVCVFTVYRHCRSFEWRAWRAKWSAIIQNIYIWTKIHGRETQGRAACIHSKEPVHTQARARPSTHHFVHSGHILCLLELMLARTPTSFGATAFECVPEYRQGPYGHVAYEFKVRASVWVRALTIRAFLYNAQRRNSRRHAAKTEYTASLRWDCERTTTIPPMPFGLVLPRPPLRTNILIRCDTPFI